MNDNYELLKKNVRKTLSDAQTKLYIKAENDISIIKVDNGIFNDNVKKCDYLAYREKEVSNFIELKGVKIDKMDKILSVNKERRQMEKLIWETAEELDQKLAQRVRNIRKRRSISQEKLSSMSGVSYGSIKRFETTGQISLISLTKIAMALDIADELRNIFTHVPYKDIRKVINEGR